MQIPRSELEKKRSKLKSELPHLFGYKWYRWAKAFFNSLNRMNLLCAANQISKSSTAIRKNIHFATDKPSWKKIWPKNPSPKQFWYLYPTADVATAEFQLKWVPEFMPKRGQFISERGKEECHDPLYGWKAIYVKRKISELRFTSGVTIFFKTYTQNVHHLQSGTVHMITCDEELPEELYDELSFRLTAVDGIFNMIFTATRNQILWLLALEGKGEMEKFKSAFKLQVSMYDCQLYEDGSPGHYPLERIKEIEEKCKSETERERRVMGRFVTEIGRKYGSFDAKTHFIKPFKIPSDWRYYGGVDPGSGGAGGHPCGMGIIAVSPDYRRGVVCRGWRGDKIDTTAGDCLKYYIKMRDSISCVQQVYDWASKDFYTIATRCGEVFNKAEKSHEDGEEVVNTLFHHGMLQIFDTPELRKLGIELMTLRRDTNKRDAKDDLIDGALRYPAMSIPWDFTAIQGKKSDIEVEVEKAKASLLITPEQFEADEISRRRGEDTFKDSDNTDWADYEREIEEWNDCAGC